MNIPPSDKFTPVDLSACFNSDRIDLDDKLKLLRSGDDYFGDQAFQGVPFALGSAGQTNVVLLDKDEITLQVNQKATYVLFLHIVEQHAPRSLDGLPDFGGDGFDGGGGASGDG
ncbi:MAG: hypothetical protein HOC74_29980, partial [Gemmatimonadetes bacterium]|nr:hypothetical protein [Gemmatimonadota bacterium]